MGVSSRWRGAPGWAAGSRIFIHSPGLAEISAKPSVCVRIRRASPSRPRSRSPEVPGGPACFVQLGGVSGGLASVSLTPPILNPTLTTHRHTQHKQLRHTNKSTHPQTFTHPHTNMLCPLLLRFLGSGQASTEREESVWQSVHVYGEQEV